MKNKVSQLSTYKYIKRNPRFGVRGLSGYVEGSWRGKNNARKYPRLLSAGFQLLTTEEIAAVICYLFSSALTILLNVPFISFLSVF
jgi:hypothetical protein